MLGILKKAASSVLATLPYSHTGSTLRASNSLRPCWTDFLRSFPFVADVDFVWGLYELLIKNIPQAHTGNHKGFPFMVSLSL